MGVGSLHSTELGIWKERGGGGGGGGGRLVMMVEGSDLGKGSESTDTWLVWAFGWLLLWRSRFWLRRLMGRALCDLLSSPFES